jgi:hypothetical protein
LGADSFAIGDFGALTPGGGALYDRDSDSTEGVNIMLDRRFIAALLLVGAFFAGRELFPRSGVGSSFAWPQAARADDIIRVGISPDAAGNQFVSTSGGNAYLWRWNGERVELVGQCARIEQKGSPQAAYVWLPGVEQGP